MRLFHQVLVVAFGLSLSAASLARNPPALVRRQQAAAQATESGGGYRDMNSRFGNMFRRPSQSFESGGYRDMNKRFKKHTVEPACGRASSPVGS